MCCEVMRPARSSTWIEPLEVPIDTLPRNSGPTVTSTVPLLVDTLSGPARVSTMCTLPFEEISLARP